MSGEQRNLICKSVVCSSATLFHASPMKPGRCTCTLSIYAVAAINSIVDHCSQFQTMRQITFTHASQALRLFACDYMPNHSQYGHLAKRFRGNSLIDAGALGLSGDEESLHLPVETSTGTSCQCGFLSECTSKTTPKIGCLDPSCRSTNSFSLPLEPW